MIDDAARGKVAIVGYAHSAIARHHDRPLGAVTVDVARAAIADAGLVPDAVDGFVASSLSPTAGSHQTVEGVTTVSANWLAEHLGLTPRFVSGFQGYGQLPGSVALAVNAIASGAASTVVVHRALHNPAGRYHGNAALSAAGGAQWTMPQGFFGPLPTIGMLTNEYFQRYGASRATLAAVVTEARKNGARIPWSYWFERPLTEDEYFAAPMVAEPVCRFDCDLPVDGAAAFVLTTAERAAHLPHPPVYIAGHASSQPPRRRLSLHWPLDDVVEGGATLAKNLWNTTGLSAAQVDLPQLYDGFSPFVLLWLEALGFCPPGDAHRFVTDGGIDSDSLSGLPVLSGGGALGNGRMHGVPQMLEAYVQLSRRAGDRQRAAEVAVACHASPHYGGAIAYTAQPI